MAAPPDPAEVLLSKACEDHHLATLVVNDDSVSDEHVGFFCQQAIEKAIKSVLSRRSVRYRRTHDLAELIDLLTDHRIDHPPELEASIDLTPFAAEMRYDYLPGEQGDQASFDRAAAVALAATVIKWAEGFAPGAPDTQSP
jgi:HEPN domain-containing protein